MNKELVVPPGSNLIMGELVETGIGTLYVVSLILIRYIEYLAYSNG
jgi:hypothetical protein